MKTLLVLLWEQDRSAKELLKPTGAAEVAGKGGEAMPLLALNTASWDVGILGETEVPRSTWSPQRPSGVADL